MPSTTDKPARVRPATGADVPALVSLLDLLFTQEADFTPNAARQERAVRHIINTPSVGIIFVACSADHSVIGMVSLMFTVSTATGGRAAWLEDMIVVPEARQSGIGSQLLQRAVSWAREHGITRLTLLTDHHNVEALRFYQRHGFAPSAMTVLRQGLSQVSLTLDADETAVL